MSGELDAAGAMATAGLAAGALEGREPAAHGEGACLNCGAALSGRFCSACGQAAHPHRTLAHVFEEFLHGVLHFDTKAWRTVPMVIFRPGTLTRNYVMGRRARYISPLALFLFSIFFMFFMFAIVGGPSVGAGPGGELEIRTTDAAEAREEIAAARARLEAARAQSSAGVHDEPSQRMATEAAQRAEERLRRLDEALQQATRSRQTSDVEAPEGGQRWQDEVRAAVERGDLTANTGIPALDEKIEQSLLNPDLALYKMQQAAYKFSFLLAPLSLPFIALLFLWKRGLTLYDHIVYALYALSFASVLFVTLTFAVNLLRENEGIARSLSSVLLLSVLPVHTFFHLKGAYALGWFSALWRTFLMLIFAVLIAALFLLLIVMLGLAG